MDNEKLLLDKLKKTEDTEKKFKLQSEIEQELLDKLRHYTDIEDKNLIEELKRISYPDRDNAPRLRDKYGLKSILQILRGWRILHYEWDEKDDAYVGWNRMLDKKKEEDLNNSPHTNDNGKGD